MITKQAWVRKTEAKSWFRASQDFPAYADVVSDPDGIFNRWLEQAKIEPFNARERRYDPGWSLGPRVIDDSHWQWFKDGGGWLTIGLRHERFRFQPGDMLLVPNGVPHTIRYTGRHRASVVTVRFRATLYAGISLLPLLGFPYVLRGSRDAPFGPALAKIAREFALQAPGWKQAMRGLIWEVLLYIVRHRGHCFHPLGGEHNALANEYLLRLLPMLEWLENHLHEPSLTVGDLARKTGVSEVYLRTLFRRALGVAPVNYIHRCRIQRACDLLRSTPLSVKEIAAQTGFSYPSFFGQLFSRFMKMSPNQYRASMACVKE